MEKSLLDTDILSEVLKAKDPHVFATAQRYIARYDRLCFSTMSIFELIRGMYLTRATRQMAHFRSTVASSDIIEVSTPVLMRAAQLWADARANGFPCNDADLIIAAAALENQRVLVTGNTSHFSWINGLSLDNWRKSGVG